MVILLNRDERLKLRGTKEFNSTNKIWNDLKLNHKRRIGSLMYIAKESQATTFEEWEHYYFKSGKERKELMNRYLQRDEFIRINNEYGRTEEDLLEIAKEFKKYVNMPLSTLYNYVYIRVIDETWIGLNRELKALKIIQRECDKYNGLTVSDVDYYTDTTYAVDFEIKKNNYRILAIQLKSMKYFKSDLDGVIEIKGVNALKNKEYTDKYGVDVLYLYIDKGYIVNLDELKSFLTNCV